MMHVTATTGGLVGTIDGEHRLLTPEASVDDLLTIGDPMNQVERWFRAGTTIDSVTEVLAPIGRQEVWAAGVTYLRSRVARVAESKQAGGDTFYDLVYDAERPELFFKATPNRVVGHGGTVRIRRDSTWDVPEPELALVVNSSGAIIGHTIGNDMSSRSIEGENPLYLPQAKLYAACASLGPRLVLSGTVPDGDCGISMQIERDGDTVFDGSTSVSQIKRSFDELVEYLFRDNEFPFGVFLMTGTGIVPGDDFTLAAGDEIHISIDSVGTLVNRVG